MCSPSVIDFAKRALSRVIFPESLCDQSILEVGSFNVNGSVREWIESLHPAKYLGVDIQEGPGVNEIVDCENLTEHVGANSWDVVISTEMLEHVTDWRACMYQMWSAVAPAGVLLVTTRSPGFPYHPFPVDNWRYTSGDMRRIFDALRMTRIVIEDDDPDSPGVFVMGRKFYTQEPGSLESIEVAAVNG